MLEVTCIVQFASDHPLSRGSFLLEDDRLGFGGLAHLALILRCPDPCHVSSVIRVEFLAIETAARLPRLRRHGQGASGAVYAIMAAV